MIRTSKHIISTNTNSGKLSHLDKLFIDYKHDLELYISFIIDGILPLKINMSSKDLPNENIKHSKYKREIYKQASSIIRSQIDKAKKKRFNNYKNIYAYFKNNNKQIKFINLKFSELWLKNILKSKYFTIPLLNNISINLTDEFYNIQRGNYFDSFINLKLPYFNERGTRAIQINIPLNHHRHSNSLLKDGFKSRNNIQIKSIKNLYYIDELDHYHYIGQRQQCCTEPKFSNWHFGKIYQANHWDQKLAYIPPIAYFDGGSTYILSKPAMQIVNNVYNSSNIDKIRQLEIYEDVMIGNIMHNHKIKSGVINYSITGDK